MGKKIVKLTLGILLLIPIIGVAQHTNILISSLNNPNEPSICINPKNTNQLVAGSNISNLYSSEDGGLTWKVSNLTSSHGVWGDPVIGVDTASNFYFLHLSNPANGNWIDRIVCQRRDAGSETWNNGSFTGLNGKKAQDKHWIAVDPKTNYLHITWTEFDKYGSNASIDSSRILYSRSEDQGDTWSTPVKINEISGDCIDSDNTTEGAVPAIGPDGQIYVSWAGPEGLVFDKSLDGGNTWLNEDIKVTDIPGGWDFSVPGISRCNGLPFTFCDLTDGPFKGNIYINWSDQRNGADNTDVWLVKSTDGGNTWSQPKKVNNDNSVSHQFFTSMTIDQATGYLWFVFYDRRDYLNLNTDVFMALSKNGGESFENFKISDSPFLPNSGVFFGDYTFVTAHNNVVRPIWTRLNDGDLSIWTAIIDTKSTSNVDFPVEKNEPIISPNPSKNKAFYSFKLHQTEFVQISLLNNTGDTIAVLKNKILGAGKYIEEIDATKLGLVNGIYYIKKVLGKEIQTTKLVIESDR